MCHVDEILLHVPGTGRTALGTKSAVQADILVLHHDAAGLEIVGDVKVLSDIGGRGLEAGAQIGLLAVLRKCDAVHRADIDARIAFDAQRGGENGLYVAIEAAIGLLESERCLNCDIQTVFTGPLCIECDACVDICPMDCITFTENGAEEELRDRLSAPATNLSQDLYIGNSLKTGRIMVKDEDVCLHCGLCAERCPTGAWDMTKYLIDITMAGPACRSR